VTRPEEIDIEPAPGLRCRACDGKVDAATLRCERCSAAYGEQNRCPQCGIVAGTEPAAGLGRCRSCGALRLSPRLALTRSGREGALLARADRAGRSARLARLGAALSAAASVALLVLAIAVLVHHVSLGLIALASLTLAPLAAATWLALKARRASAERSEALERGLLLVAGEIVSQSPDTDAEALADALAIPRERAETLLAALELEDLLAQSPAALRLAPAPAGDTLTERSTEPVAETVPAASRFAEKSGQ
jgi:hypothetical protein